MLFVFFPEFRGLRKFFIAFSNRHVPAFAGRDRERKADKIRAERID